MPCLTPYRGDTSQMLLFKIASCLEANPGGSGVISFNGRTGDVILSLADVAAVADGRYVLKTGDTMTGALVHPDGTAALPSITFTGDLNTGIFHPSADVFAITTGGSERLRVSPTGMVGIGTSNPLFPLHLVSTISNFFTAERNSPVVASFLNKYNPNTTDGNGVFINFSSDTTGAGATVNKGFARFSAVFVTHNDATMESNLQFEARSNGSALTPVLKLGGSDVIIPTGIRLAIPSGTNQRAGDVTLVGGTVTTANTTVTANTRVFVSRKTIGGTPGTEYVYTLVAGASFTITSNLGTDTSVISYLLIEVP